MTYASSSHFLSKFPKYFLCWDALNDAILEFFCPALGDFKPPFILFPDTPLDNSINNGII